VLLTLVGWWRRGRNGGGLPAMMKKEVAEADEEDLAQNLAARAP
jgi:hypothetical protein